jgi:hypothetical protein
MGGAPPGVPEARALVRAKNVDALRRILRGANLEGRALAAVGLSFLGALDLDDRRVVGVLASGSGIESSAGCGVTREPAESFFDDLAEKHYVFRR